MSTINRTKVQNADQKMVDGLTKHKAVITALAIGGRMLTPDDVIATFQARIDASNEALTTKASATAAVLAERAERARTKRFVSSARQVVRSMFGESVDLLADFGLAPPRPRRIDPQKKVEAAAKSKATRKLRHTMGKKQKAAIKATGPLASGTQAHPTAAGDMPVASAEPVLAAVPTAPTTTASPPATQVRS
jgi:hypothetical protein